MPHILTPPSPDYFLQQIGMPVSKDTPDGQPDIVVQDGDTTYMCWAYGRLKIPTGASYVAYKICRITKSTLPVDGGDPLTVTRFEYPYGCTGYNFILNFNNDYGLSYYLLNYTYTQKAS